MIFMGFLWIHHESGLVEHFHYYIRNQRVKIRECEEFDGNIFCSIFNLNFF